MLSHHFKLYVVYSIEYVFLFPFTYFHGQAFFFTESKILWYTSDRGQKFENIKLPLEPNTLGRPIIDFHPTKPDWLLFLGGTKCPGCHTVAYVSKDNGKNWENIETWAEKCIFGEDVEFREIETSAIFCSAYKDKDYPIGQDGIPGSTEANPLQLISISHDDYKVKKVLISGIVEYFVFNEYMAVAKEKNGQLILYTSMNGENFAEAQFPPDVSVEKQVNFNIELSKI